MNDMIDMRAAEDVIGAEKTLANLSERFPGSTRQLLHELPLFMPPHILRRIAFFDDIYRRIVTVPGIIMEFGVRYGRDLAILDALRTLHEPLNSSRTLVGFDTFTGFPAINDCDGDHDLVRVGGFDIGERYDDFLTAVMQTRERMSPLAHIQKFEIRAGDAPDQLATYLKERPQTVVAFTYFDMDLYEPTKRCLELLLPHMTRGAVIGFDELNSPEFPGETLAVREVLGLDRIRLQRTMRNPGWPCFAVIE